MRISDWSSDVCSSDLQPGKVGISRTKIIDRNCDATLAQATELVGQLRIAFDQAGFGDFQLKQIPGRVGGLHRIVERAEKIGPLKLTRTDIDRAAGDRKSVV